jgi:hypothetical protein
MTQPETPAVEQKSVAGPALLYLRVMLGSFCLVFLLLVGVLYHATMGDELPPLPLTDSIGFNDKAVFVRNAVHSVLYDIVAAGSSMTMNNFAADAFTEEMPDHPRVLNIGSFSMKISDTRHWLEGVLRYSHPKYIIMVTGMMDFYSQQPLLNISDEEIRTFLSDSRSSRIFEFVRTISLQYYADNWGGVHTRRLDHGYDSLAYDRSGSVRLDVYYPNIDPKRWNAVPTAASLNEEEYAQLALLAKGLRGRGLDLVLVQGPMRRRALIAGRVDLDRHWHRVETIIGQSGQRFIDLHALDYDDSYFADYSHLNAKGSLAFTRELENRLLRLSTTH